MIAPPRPWLHRFGEHDDWSKADVISSALRLELQTEGGATRPTFIGPASPAPHARNSSITVAGCRGLRGRQIGISTAGQACVIPITTPFVDVPVHVMYSP